MLSRVLRSSRTLPGQRNDLKPPHHFRRNPVRRGVLGCGDFLQEVLDEDRDVVRPLRAAAAA